MLRLFAVLALILLAACKREPDFDTRYKAAEQQLQASSAAIDRELNAAQSDAAAAGIAASDGASDPI